MATITRAKRIINKMEDLAIDLLQKVEDKESPDVPKPTLEAKLDVFQQVANWVKINSKLEEDDGGGIAEYKRKLAGEGAERRRGNREKAGLSRLKSRLPSADAGQPDGDSNAVEREAPGAARGNGRLRAGADDGAESGHAEDHNQSGV